MAAGALAGRLAAAAAGQWSLAVLLLASQCSAFSPHHSPPLTPVPSILRSRSAFIRHQTLSTALGASAASSTESDTSSSSVSTVFDFTGDNGKPKSVDQFERIDDAIMGGISLSALKDVPDKDYASWSGVCRTDGGGFCGMRTLPFEEPLDAAGSDGVFVDCRLASDDEPERRVWKITCRTESSRGEIVYQAAFPLPKEASGEGSGFARVKVPFEDFQLVRGPRIVPDAPKLNITGGVYQIGMSLSKFVIGVNTTELEGFRPGFFDLNIRRIGFYSDKVEEPMAAAVSVKTLSKEEVKKKRPVLLKILLPISKLFFSEKANRRKSAMRILKEKRGLSRGKAVLWGIKSRANSKGILSSLAATAGIFAIDSFRTVLGTALRLCLFYPLKALGEAIKFIKQYIFGMKRKELPKMTE